MSNEVAIPIAGRAEQSEMGECLWSPAVALDPKHRPQVLHEPSSTVRRSWCKYPQEAHLLDEANWRYRRLSVDEIAVLQGFEPSWFRVPGLTERTRVKAIGDAVPPALGLSVVRAITDVASLKRDVSVEICAGSGGLASAAAIMGLEHAALIDFWRPACAILTHGKPWRADVVQNASVRDVDFRTYRGEVAILSGGPPCQPWSQGGLRLGEHDSRDLLGVIDEVVGTVEPEAFVFENVPGLTTAATRPYLQAVIDRLRTPRGSKRQYGVVAGVLNAADFGVPQLRRRLFIVGLRDLPNADAYQVFDRIQASATHRDPRKPHRSRARWRTVGEALAASLESGEWRKWVDLTLLAASVQSKNRTKR